MQLLHPDGLHLLGEYSESERKAFNFALPTEKGFVLLANLANLPMGELAADFDALEAQGGIAAIFLNDRHNAKNADIDRIAERFEARIECSEIEAAILRKHKVKRLAPFALRRHKFTPDFEVIPIPGHTPGAVAFLWSGETTRFLFVGDTLSFVDGEWEYFVTKSNIPALINSFEKLKSVDFDVLVSNSFINTQLPLFPLSADEKEALFDQLIEQLRESR